MRVDLAKLRDASHAKIFYFSVLKNMGTQRIIVITGNTPSQRKKPAVQKLPDHKPNIANKQNDVHRNTEPLSPPLRNYPQKNLLTLATVNKYVVVT